MKSVLTTFILIAVVSLTVPGVQAAFLTGTVALVPSDTVVPGLTSAAAGTLLASLSAPWTSSLGTSSGTLVSAVYRNPSGTLDFYYQVTDNLTAPNCGGGGQPACDPLSRETDTDFITWATAVGFRIDGASLPGGVFVNGTVAPITADRNGVGNVVGFSFIPPDSSKIQPGQTSNVLVISTNAMNFKAGNASVIDGGVTTVSSFEPASGVPEPASLLLIGGGFVALAFVRRSQARKAR
jgi:hypothetical protein